MISFTRQERAVLSVVLVIIAGASFLRFMARKYPRALFLYNFIDRYNYISKKDVNKASYDELLAIPYIGPYTAREIIRYRTENGPIRDLRALKKIKGIREKNYEIFTRYLSVRKLKDAR